MTYSTIDNPEWLSLHFAKWSISLINATFTQFTC